MWRGASRLDGDDLVGCESAERGQPLDVQSRVAAESRYVRRDGVDQRSVARWRA